MTIIKLYTGGGVSLTPTYEDGRSESAYVRLVAGDGKTLQKGSIVTPCIDVLRSYAEGWNEIDAPIEDDDIDEAEAFDIIFGGGAE